MSNTIWKLKLLESQILHTQSQFLDKPILILWAQNKATCFHDSNVFQLAQDTHVKEFLSLKHNILGFKDLQTLEQLLRH